MSIFFEKLDTFLDGCKAGLRAGTESISAVLNTLSKVEVGLAIIVPCFLLLVLYNILKTRGSILKPFSHTKALVICALLMAVNIVLGYFSLPLSNYLRIGFGFITQPVVAMLFGPIPACIIGMAQDFIKLVLKPTGPYWPPYGLCVGMAGMLYGMMLYKKEITFPRVYLANLLVSVVINMCLSSIALAPTVGSGLVGILPARIIKEVLVNVVPVHAAVNFLILKYVKKLRLTL